MGFSRQESWTGLLFPSPRDLPDPGNEAWSSALQIWKIACFNSNTWASLVDWQSRICLQCRKPECMGLQRVRQDWTTNTHTYTNSVMGLPTTQVDFWLTHWLVMVSAQVSMTSMRTIRPHNWLFWKPADMRLQQAKPYMGGPSVAYCERAPAIPHCYSLLFHKSSRQPTSWLSPYCYKIGGPLHQ